MTNRQEPESTITDSFISNCSETSEGLRPGHHPANSVVGVNTEIKNLISGENRALMHIDPDSLSQGLSLPAAEESAISAIEQNPILFAIDIMDARKEGIRPFPVDIAEISANSDEEIKGCIAESKEPSRRIGWERKLLDLSLRNVMLNLRLTKSIVPVMENDIAKVVEYLQKNKLSELAGYPDKDNIDLLKNLYRAARTSIEENGANTLFVSLGALRWFDVGDTRPHIAPLLFIPVSIVRKKGMNYEIRPREDEAMVNVTLIEMLRQMFGVEFPELDQLPEDEEGFPDWQKVFEIFNEHIMGVNRRQPEEGQWEITHQSYIGIFSFKKFLMWHDVHYNPEVIDRHHVLRGLIDNHYDAAPTGKGDHDARKIELEAMFNLMLPVDYDSSQLEAVAESHSGQSFVLHGPPGTGKSQTITNMIADALSSGKRVLFVAEKKAALDVVRSRLNSIGLKPYCLELHSNKADKKSFFAQVKDSAIGKLGKHFNSPARRSQKYPLRIEYLKTSQQVLRDVINALHSKRANGLSLYDCVNRLLSAGAGKLKLGYDDIRHLVPEEVDALCAEYNELDLVAEIMGRHPGSSDLIGIYPRENSADNQESVSEAIKNMPETIVKSRKKAVSLINRWFRKLTPEEILFRSDQWQLLNDLAMIDEEKCTDIDTIENNIRKWNAALGELRKWSHFSERAGRIRNYNLPKALEFYLSGESGHETSDSIYGSYYRAQADRTIDRDKHLRNFYSELHDLEVKHYRGHATKLLEITREELIRRIEEDITNTDLSYDEKKELTLLERRMQTNGRRVALRKVLADAGNIIGKLFPCMLMSPLSVAQYLDMKSDLFDIVIFDEASQIETSDAVGTIARGRSLVVVGDPLQLPPTRFFTSQSNTGEDMEESEDADSILEDCIALGMRSRYLSRHYRSHHESLIAFSNSHFYKNRLLTFPSYNDSELKVSFINPKGEYDIGKTRTNRIEAEAVVKHVMKLLQTYEKAPSIGIVAFSKAQSNLIEDILYASLQKKRALQQKLNEAEEELFIKNLENVQGDERDIIIFSVGYGPDENGNVSLNFGPLNKIGGERRLNVAVSRARDEMIVFSSLLPQHIPSERVTSKGVNAMRNFLVYAIDGTMPNVQPTESEQETIVEDIAGRLRECGLQVNTKIGRSDFKIDIAVVDKENPEHYCLGIIIDGRDYYALPTVRDREMTVPSVLKSLGWEIHRVWTIDWLENPDKVLDKILKKLKHEREVTI